MAKRNFLWIWTALPLVLFLVLLVFLWFGLGRNPNQIPSPLIDKPMPAFQAKQLFYPLNTITNKDIEGKVTLVNVFASWCMACKVEHPVIVQMAQTGVVPIYGIDYKDNRAAAQQFLREYGNPYKKIVFDKEGNIAINLGVYGTPEMYLLNKQGLIVYKHIGAMNWHTWEDVVLPKIKKLQQS